MNEDVLVQHKLLSRGGCPCGGVVPIRHSSQTEMKKRAGVQVRIVRSGERVVRVVHAGHDHVCDVNVVVRSLDRRKGFDAASVLEGLSGSLSVFPGKVLLLEQAGGEGGTVDGSVDRVRAFLVWGVSEKVLAYENYKVSVLKMASGVR